MLVQDLIDMLERLNPEAENSDVYLFERSQEGYLTSDAQNYIGW